MTQTLENQKILHPGNVSKETTLRAVRFRAPGGGQKVGNKELEDDLYQWILERRNDSKHVSRKTIQKKAQELAQEMGWGKPFSASNGWCNNFMKRYNLSVRQKTHQSQRLPDELVPKVVNFFWYLRKYFANNPIQEDQIVAMDETCVRLENVSNKTVSVAGKRLVSKF